MKPEFWLDIWNTEDIRFHQAGVNPYLETFFNKLTFSQGDEVFVPLCGKSRDMLWLHEQGCSVLGVELSKIAARDFFADHFFTENKLQADISALGAFECWRSGQFTLLCGDFFDLNAAELKNTSVVYDRAALIALPLDMRRRYANHLKMILSDVAEILLISREYPQTESDGPPFSVMEDEVNVLYGDRYSITCLDEVQLLEKAKEKGLSYLLEKVYHLKPLV